MSEEVLTTFIKSFFKFMEVFCGCGAVVECIRCIVACVKYGIECGNIEESNEEEVEEEVEE